MLRNIEKNCNFLKLFGSACNFLSILNSNSIMKFPSFSFNMKRLATPKKAEANNNLQRPLLIAGVGGHQQAVAQNLKPTKLPKLIVPLENATKIPEAKKSLNSQPSITLIASQNSTNLISTNSNGQQASQGKDEKESSVTTGSSNDFKPSTAEATRGWKKLIGLPYETDNDDVEDKPNKTLIRPPQALVREKIQQQIAANVVTPVLSSTTTPPPVPLVREKVQEVEIIPPGSTPLDFSIPARSKRQNLSIPPPSRKPGHPVAIGQPHPQPPPSQSSLLVQKKAVVEAIPVRPETPRGHGSTVEILEDKPQQLSTETPSGITTLNATPVIEPLIRPTAAIGSRNKPADKLPATLTTKPSLVNRPLLPPSMPIRVNNSVVRTNFSNNHHVKNSTTTTISNSSSIQLAKNKHHTHKLATVTGQKLPKPKKKKPIVKFVEPRLALAKEGKEHDMVAGLDGCSSYEDAPIWLCFRLWDYEENMRQLKKFMELETGAECRGDEIADMKKIFDFHGMNTCLDCFMLDEECNMRNVGYIIDDDVLISFNNILPYMTQYFVDLRDTFYGKSPAQNALIRQWINYCVRNIRGRRVSEYMWDEMNDHLGNDDFFGGSYRTMADTLMYVSLYNRVRRWEPVDFAKRYNLARWFRLMQMDDRLRGGNQLLEISNSSEFHPNYPFDYIQPDLVDLKDLVYEKIEVVAKENCTNIHKVDIVAKENCTNIHKVDKVKRKKLQKQA